MHNAQTSDRARIDDLTAQLRERDSDPAYRDAPILDAYARISVSPDDETEKTDRQTVDVLTAILNRNARLGEIHVDESLSAWKLTGKRPGWRRLVERLKNGDAAGVMGWHTDRLMRQPRDLEELIRFGDRGLILGSCQGDYDLGSSDHRLTLRVLVASACKASDDASRRARRKREDMRSKGQHTGGARPMGFQAGGKCGGGTCGHDEDERCSRVPDERVAAEREAIVWAATALLSGASLATVAAEWRSRGITIEHNGAPYEPKTNTVRGVMLRARNAGLVEHEGNVVGEMVDASEIRLYPVETFDALRSLFAARRRGRPVSADHLLSGVLRCSTCGAGMVGSTRKDKPYPDGEPRRRYACGNEMCDDRLSIDARAAEAWAKDETLSVLTDPEHAAMVAEASAALAKVETQIGAAEEMLKELDRRLGEGKFGDDLKKSLARYDAATEPVERRLDALKAERTALLESGAGAIRTGGPAQVARRWESTSTTNEQRRIMVREAMPYGIAVYAPGPGPRRGSDPSMRLRVIPAQRRAERG
jgi:site-specific DNA recombinase